MVTRKTRQGVGAWVLALAALLCPMGPARSDEEPAPGTRITGRVAGLAMSETARVEVRRRDGPGRGGWWGWGGPGTWTSDPLHFEHWLDDEATTGEPIATCEVSGKAPSFAFEELDAGHYEIRMTRGGGAGSDATALWHDGRRGIEGLVLPPGELRLRTRLTDSQGRPFQGLVRAHQRERSFVAAPTVFRTAQARADGDGVVEFAGLVHGPVHLLALVPGRLRVHGPSVDLPHPETLAWTVEPGPLVSGVVRSLDDDEPVTGAMVFACRTDRTSTAVVRTESDEAGAFRLPASGERAVLLVLAPHLAPAWLEPGDTTDVGAVRLAPTAEVYGWVKDADGRPIPDVRVIAEPGWPFRAERPSLETRTDPSGRYRLEAVPPGEVRLYAHDRTWMTALLEEADVGWSEYDPLTTVVAPGERHRRDLAVVPAARIRGRVLDAAGLPVGGAHVWSSPDGLEEGVLTDAAGAFVLEGLVPDRSYTVGAATPRRERVRAKNVVAGAEPEPVVLRIGEENFLEVEVVADEDESPLPGVRVVVYQSYEYEDQSGTTRLRSAPVFTDAQGRARPSRLRAGPLRIEVSAPGWAAAHRDGVLETVSPEPFRLKRAPEPPRLQIRGRVEAPSGVDLASVELRHSQVNEPLVGLWAEDGGRLVPVESDGTFALEVSEPGRYGLRARVAAEVGAHGYFAQAAHTVGDADVVLRLSPAPWIEARKRRAWTFRIVDRDHRLVPGGFAAGPHGESCSPSTRAFFHGHLRVPATEEIEAATFTFHALDVCGIWLPFQTTVVGPVAPGVEVIEVVLAPEVPIQGVVLDPEGKGIPGVRIRASRLDDLDGSGGFLERATRTHPDGRFRLGGLGDVSCRLEVAVPFAMAPIRPLLLDAWSGRHVEIPIRLRRAVAPQIQVVDPQGAPLAGAALEIQPDESDFTTFQDNVVIEGFYSGPGYVNETCDAEGKTALTRLDPERGYVLWVFPPEGRDDLAPRYFGAWRPQANQRIELFPWVELRGRVEDASGVPVADATVYVRQPGAEALEARATSDAGGRFTLSRLRQGAVALRADEEETGLLHTTTNASDVVLVVER